LKNENHHLKAIKIKDTVVKYLIGFILISLIPFSSCIDQDKKEAYKVEGEWTVTRITLGKRTLPKDITSKYFIHLKEGGTYSAFFLDVRESGKWLIDGTGTTLILNPIDPPDEPDKEYIIKEMTENTLSMVWFTGGENIAVVLDRKGSKESK